MPTTPTYPGVYIEEVPSRVRTIVGVSTSVTAFLGYFTKGPVNAAVRILSMSDFEREFGGLHRASEASYGIRQFFLNGGTEAWVVRVAHSEETALPISATAAATASLEINDSRGTPSTVLEVSAGRRVRGRSVEDPGQWGNSLRLQVDYDTPDPANLFNLTILQLSEDGRTALATERHSNLSMTAGTAEYAVETVNERSRLVQLVRDTSWTPPDPSLDPPVFPGPAATGTLGAPFAGTITIPGDGASLTATVDGGTDLEITLDYGGATVEDMATVAAYLQRAIRQAGARALPRQPLAAGAVVRLLDIGGGDYRLHIAGDQRTAALQPEATLTFSNAGADPTATNLGLVDAAVNVQQYQLGSMSSLGFDGGETVGADGDLPNAAVLSGNPEDKTGFYALRDVDLFNILSVPRASELDAEEMTAFVSEALDFCEERRAMMIVDIPEGVDSVPRMEVWMAQNDTLRRANAATYFPRPRVPDPLNGYRLKSLAASGTIAGLYARTDAGRGVWKAPAGTEAGLQGIQELAYKLTDAENGVLNPLGINCLRTFPVFGNLCWGARTLMGSNVQASEWKYLPVRRTALYIEESLYRGTQWVVFEPNDEPLWSQIRLNVGAFMHRLFRQGAFQGSTPRDAYFVKCDKETTTQDDINQGIVNILVGFAPLKPAEFVIIKISQIGGQIPT